MEANGIKGVHLTLHRHFSPYEMRDPQNEEEEVASIPFFPVWHNLEDVDVIKEHALQVFKEIADIFNQSNLEIYLSHGSSGRPSISVIDAYSHFVMTGNFDWKLYNLTFDDEYRSDQGKEVKGYQMTIDSSKSWQEKSARQREEITHLKTELSKTTALLGGLEKEITHLKTELAGLDSEL